MKFSFLVSDIYFHLLRYKEILSLKTGLAIFLNHAINAKIFLLWAKKTVISQLVKELLTFGD